MSKEKCDCELPGFFYTGVRGVVGHLPLTPDSMIERCDACERFATDAEAEVYLKGKLCQ